jgi:hypothetical protein|tara:strand:- start:612 stop:785 length:174 start_codon:yes stop_codon:yes gene_type:complete
MPGTRKRMNYRAGGDKKKPKTMGMGYMMYGGSHNMDPRMEAARFKGSSSLKRSRGRG